MMMFQSKRTFRYEIENSSSTPLHTFISLKDLTPAMIHIVAESIQKQDDDTLLKCIVDLAENTPKFLRSQIEPLLQMCVQTMANEELLDSWRHLALEVIVTLAETAPASVRKCGATLIPVVVSTSLKMMTDLDDDEDWSTSDDLTEEDNDSNSVVAEAALDRMACGIGGKSILPHILSSLPTMLQNPDWKYRHAALMAISAVGEGCHKVCNNEMLNLKFNTHNLRFSYLGNGTNVRSNHGWYPQLFT